MIKQNRPEHLNVEITSAWCMVHKYMTTNEKQDVCRSKYSSQLLPGLPQKWQTYVNES